MRQLHRFGTAEMLLASLALQSTIYRNFMAEHRTKRFRILDSGSFEVAIGTSKTVVEMKDYIELALLLDVDEIVALDEPQNPRGSTLRTRSFIKQWKQYFDSKRPSIMLVPQGKSIAEWLHNADLLLSELPGATIGIPRTLGERCAPDDPFFRLQLARTVIADTRCRTVHLLGANKHLLQEVDAAASMTKIVRSIDTTALHRTAFAKLETLREYQPPISLEEKKFKIEQDVVVTLHSELLSALSKHLGDFAFRRNCSLQSGGAGKSGQGRGQSLTGCCPKSL